MQMASSYDDIKRAICANSDGGDLTVLNSLNPTVVLEGDQSYHNDTLLHYATANNRLALLQPLVDAGSNINAQNAWGRTPIHYACYRGHRQFALRLAELGADPTILSKCSPARSALDEARNQWNTAELLQLEEAFEASQVMLK